MAGDVHMADFLPVGEPLVFHVAFRGVSILMFGARGDFVHLHGHCL